MTESEKHMIVEDLASLLEEWLETPHFLEEEGRLAWSARFRPRVEAALKRYLEMMGLAS